MVSRTLQAPPRSRLCADDHSLRESLNRIKWRWSIDINPAIYRCTAILTRTTDDDAAQDLVRQLRQIADIPVHADIAVGAAEPARVDTEALGDI